MDKDMDMFKEYSMKAMIWEVFLPDLMERCSKIISIDTVASKILKELESKGKEQTIKELIEEVIEKNDQKFGDEIVKEFPEHINDDGEMDIYIKVIRREIYKKIIDDVPELRYMKYSMEASKDIL